MKNNNKICAITGPTEGIGKATAFNLTAQGFHLVLVCRNLSKAENLQKQLAAVGEAQVDIVICDLSRQESVRQAAAEMNSTYDHIDVLINNAGIILNKRQLNEAGYEMMFATNHLGPFLLTNLLLPLITRSEAPRIINLASDAYKFVKSVNFDNLDWHKGFSTFKGYGQSKLCTFCLRGSLSGKPMVQALL